MKFGGGTNISNLSQAILNSVKIALPPLPEQKKIAEILSTWDRAIEVVERLIENSRAQQKALMQQLLTAKKRLPGFSREWKEIPLSEAARIEWGNTSLTKSSYVEKGFQAYSASGQDGYVEKPEWQGTGIVLSAIGARCGRCFWAEGAWTAIKNTIVLQPRKNISDGSYLFYILDSPKFWPISGGAQPFIGLKNARKIRVKTPSFNEQFVIGNILNTSQNEIDALTHLLAKLKSEKSALMQQLLTGKRRVKIAEEAAA